MRISDWSSDVCSSDLQRRPGDELRSVAREHAQVDSADRPAGIAVADDQPAARGGLQRDLPRRHADAVKGDGDALAGGALADMRPAVSVAIANDMVGAGVARRLFLALGASSADPTAEPQ